MTPILTIIGPTGTGKTNFVCQAAHKYPFEVVSMDSAMVYTELSVAANKPSEEELILCPHKAINCRSVIQSFDVAQFFDLAIESIQEILGRGKIPVIVGGTMMYAHVLQAGLTQCPAFEKIDREQFQKDWNNRPIAEAYAALCASDPCAAGRLHPTDTQRILRALELATLIPSEKEREYWRDRALRAFPFSLDIKGLKVHSVESHRALLKKRIDTMVQKGMIEEIESLFERFGSLEYGFWRFVAYRQYRQWLQGSLSLEEAKERTAFATYQLAKHQRTWMNSIVHDPVEVHVETTPLSPRMVAILNEYGATFEG